MNKHHSSAWLIVATSQHPTLYSAAHIGAPLSAYPITTLNPHTSYNSCNHHYSLAPDSTIIPRQLYTLTLVSSEKTNLSIVLLIAISPWLSIPFHLTHLLHDSIFPLVDSIQHHDLLFCLCSDWTITHSQINKHSHYKHVYKTTSNTMDGQS